MFSENDPYVGIDLDGCLINGQLVPAAQLIVDYCNSYTEISPSGTGLHIFVKGTLPAGFPNKITMVEQGFKAFEIYDRQRYFTVTGNVIGELKPIRQVDLTSLPVKLPSTSKGSPVKIGEQDLLPLIEQIKKGNEGSAFTTLHEHGDLSAYSGDQSRADLAYIGIVSK
jgi:putative DNA primase/helicase